MSVPDTKTPGAPDGLEPVSLADAPVGSSVRVEWILFDLVRAVCARAGIHEGDRVRVRARLGGTVAVETEAGQTAMLPGDCSPFVEVSG